MNPHIEKLYKITTKQHRTIIGLMSGTSLDGLDIAVCEVSGAGLQTQCKVTHFATVDYDDATKEKILSVFSKDNVDLKYLTLLNPWIGTLHARLINEQLSKWQINHKNIDLIASHGQTIYHCPSSFHNITEFKNGTLQIGDGDHIAVETGIITISDFRQKHIAAGFEGAPLAQYGDYYLFADQQKNTLLLNIGGIANFTFIGKNHSINDIICSDIGPGNTLMDQYVRRHFNLNFDQNGELASKGVVSKELLSALMSLDFVEQPMPKTTGPELFNIDFLDSIIYDKKLQLSHYDILATLNELTACCIVTHINKIETSGKVEVLLSGGGAHNVTLTNKLKDKLTNNFEVVKLDNDGINTDSKEAVLFAVLANECVMSKSADEDTQGGLTMGKLSLPL
ncbi:anhydro-N-acetylmuramic acid kinase [Pseudoalteromonas luteoviolacea]|uniref:Anhydro-N-acetylmuramic acid kinase n=1 Tax=Pseudoalteromonas luteoviolacea TaxID=43657 RepID=A0A0C1MN25_9GAMM|nr:anhydro-N-acetylmuramic acid kinase [Pseudoalteromonas luteoviolacea]KID55908.1 anhydro-N-acetylmuramic acid kinase [Pseudoalteromonas luteoviolacea]